jgi:hypothetical protein
VSAWGNSELLVQLLDRQFKFFLEQRGTRKIERLTPLLSLLEGEPQIAGVLNDLRTEAGTALAEFERSDREIRNALDQLWALHGSEIRRRLKTRDDAIHDPWPMDRVEDGLAGTAPAWFPVGSEGPEEQAKKILLALRHWWTCCVQAAEKANEVLADDFRNLAGPLSRLEATHEFIARRLREESRSLAWPAFERLVGMSSATNPRPPSLSEGDGWGTRHVLRKKAAELRKTDAFFQTNSEEKVQGVKTFYESIEADARVIHEELRLRIGLARSKRGLVERYAARCAAFDAERLRAMAAKRSTVAERLLTSDFARFLFDAGLSPVTNAEVGGVSPDILHLRGGSLFYVEAKQYAHKNPRSQLRRAYLQVWSTWAQLRNNYSVPEAFLVVFRRAGPLFIPPPLVRHDGLKLYSVVADISGQAGSKEKLPVLTLNEEELRPQEDEE